MRRLNSSPRTEQPCLLLPNILDPEHVRNAKNSLTTPLQLPPPPKAFTPYEVENAIFQLLPRKAPGHDLITPEILCHLPKKSIRFLTYLFIAMEIY